MVKPDPDAPGNLQTVGSTAAAADIGLDGLGAGTFAKELAYRLHETGRESALAARLLVFASSQFVEEWRTADGAGDVDRLIAG